MGIDMVAVKHEEIYCEPMVLNVLVPVLSWHSPIVLIGCSPCVIDLDVPTLHVSNSTVVMVAQHRIPWLALQLLAPKRRLKNATELARGIWIAVRIRGSTLMVDAARIEI